MFCQSNNFALLFLCPCTQCSTWGAAYQAANLTNWILKMTYLQKTAVELELVDGNCRQLNLFLTLWCWQSVKSAQLLLNQTLVQPPLLPPSVTVCSTVSSTAGEALCGALGFYNKSVSRVQPFTSSDFVEIWGLFTSQMFSQPSYMGLFM